VDDPAHWFAVLDQVHDSIILADQKVVSILTLNTAVIGGLLLLIRSGLYARGWEWWVGLGACGVLVVTILLGAWVIYPIGIHTNAGRGPGLVDQYRIVQHPSADDYVRAANGADKAAFARQLQEFAFDYSRTHARKYFWLRQMVVLSAVGWLSAGYSWLALNIRLHIRTRANQPEMPA
jgi:hypothetical protein